MKDRRWMVGSWGEDEVTVSVFEINTMLESVCVRERERVSERE